MEMVSRSVCCISDADNITNLKGNGKKNIMKQVVNKCSKKIFTYCEYVCIGLKSGNVVNY